MKFLIIQTAFIGDVVLATALVENLAQSFPQATIDFLLRKGNESLLGNNPRVRKVLIFDKKQNKYRNLLKMISTIRKEKYDHVINVQRFFASGLMTALSGAKETVGFDKNPLSFLFSKKISHHISATAEGVHEVNRNLSLIEHLTGPGFVKPKLYPSQADFEKIKPAEPYITISPASVWFTKQYPEDRWVNFINSLPSEYTVYLLGAKSDRQLCDRIQSNVENLKSTIPNAIQNPKSPIQNLSGQLTFIESAALMKNAAMNYVNDSAPLHFASAMNAPVTAVFCSTVPAFGFGPLSDNAHIAEIDYKLYCRPCGLHGYKKCPEGHFKCAEFELKFSR